jgi:hypothetical protein
MRDPSPGRALYANGSTHIGRVPFEAAAPIVDILLQLTFAWP